MNKHWQERLIVSAAIAFAALANDASAVSALQTMLQDKDLTVRNAAQAALAKMPNGEHQETLAR